MRTSLIVLSLVLVVVIAFVAVDYVTNIETKSVGIGNRPGDFPPPVDSGTVKATIISFENEPLREYAYPTFQVRILVNEIIDYKRFKEADYPPLKEGEELSITLTFGQRVKQEVTECPKNQTIIQSDNETTTGTGVVCPVLLSPAPTIEESVNYLSNNVGKTVVIFVHNAPNAPQEWSGAISLI